MAQRRTGSSRSTALTGRKCPSCSGVNLERRESTVRLVVDGQVESALVQVAACRECDEEIVGGDELRRAERQIRASRGDAPAYSGKLVARIGSELHEAVARSAELHHRSLNQEIIALLWTGLQSTQAHDADVRRKVVGLPTTRGSTRKR